MIKHFAAAAALAGLLSGAALAQTPTQPTPEQTPPTQVQPAPGPADQTAPNATEPAEVTLGAVPQSPDECMQTASDLAVAAEERRLAVEKVDRIEDLLTRMETHCDAKQFSEAMAVAQDIKTEIETQ